MTLWTVVRQTPLSIGFSRQDYWSGLPFSSLGDLPNPGIKLGFLALQVDSLPPEPPGKPLNIVMLCYVMLCYVMLCYVMLCYIILYYIGFLGIKPSKFMQISYAEWQQHWSGVAAAPLNRPAALPFFSILTRHVPFSCFNCQALECTFHICCYLFTYKALQCMSDLKAISFLELSTYMQ